MIYKSKHSGFTLIETLIAISVLMLAIAGPLTIAEQGLRETLIAKDQDIAFYLAQDAIEYVRWVRDTNNLCIAKGGCAAASWLSGLDGTVNGHTTNNSLGVPGTCVSATGNQSCLIDSLSDMVTSCGAAVCSTQLYYDTNTNSYLTTPSAPNGTDTVVPSIFTRTVQIVTPVGTNDCSGAVGHGCEAAVTVTVSWQEVNTVRSISVHENLFNWQ